MQVPLYYILLESWNFPLSNVIINILEFTQIITILSILVISNPNIDFENVLAMEKYSLLRFLSLRRNVTYLGSPKLGRLYHYVKSLPTFCFPHIFSSTSSSTYFAISLYHTKFALSNGAKSLICYIGK